MSLFYSTLITGVHTLEGGVVIALSHFYVKGGCLFYYILACCIRPCSILFLRERGAEHSLLSYTREGMCHYSVLL